MPINVGTNTPSNFKVGNSQVNKIFLGTNIVWQLPTVSITDQSITVQRLSTSATAGYRLNSSGIAERLAGLTYTTLETWLLSGAASDYEVRVTLSSGTLSSGTTDTWQSLGTSREWTVVDSALDASIVAAVIVVEIRDATTLMILDTATINLQADSIPG